MEYKLVVWRIETNPNYKPEYREFDRFNQPIPPPKIETEVLSVIVTVEEYEAVKRAILEVKK